MVSYEEFAKLDIRVGTILEAEKVTGSEKLLRFVVDIGSEDRQIIGGLGVAYPEATTLVGKQVPVLVNLEPRTLMGLESQGMILAASSKRMTKDIPAASFEELPVALHPDKPVEPGTKIK